MPKDKSPDPDILETAQAIARDYDASWRTIARALQDERDRGSAALASVEEHWRIVGKSEAATKARLRDTSSDVAIVGDAVVVALAYPRHDSVKAVQVALVDVRAADDIRITYDFERDGWKIEQATKHEWEVDDDGGCDPCWKETAFCKAWPFESEGAKG